MVVFLLGVVLILLNKGAIMAAIGSSMVAAGLTGWVIFLYVLTSQQVTQRLELITEFGLLDAFPNRAAMVKPKYDERLSRAATSLDILGFGLRHLRQDYINDFTNWASRLNVRILLLDPEAPTQDASWANQRDVEEGNAEGTIAGDVEDFLQATADVRNKWPENFQVRLYRAIPSVNIFRVDDEMFWGPYLLDRQSRNTSTFIVRRGGALFLQLDSHFEKLWGDDFSRPVTLHSQGEPKVD